MDTQIESAVKMFEEIEKIRRGCDAKLTHLAKNLRCLNCQRDWMPKKFEPCPECHSNNTKLMRKNRKCKDCNHIWEPADIGLCPHCHSDWFEPNPKTDPYIRDVALPRLRAEEEFYEKYMTELIKDHCAWIWASQVKGIGLTSIGRLIGKTDIYRLDTVSKMWAHCGFGLNEDGKIQQKVKGELVNYDVQLQSNCIMIGQSLNFAKDSYYEFYLMQKERHADLKPAHCHNRSFRHMIKLFLSHFWQTWREAEGLPAPKPYAFTILKHPEGHLITPQEMVKQPAISR